MTLVLLGENRVARVVKRVPEGVAKSENYLRDLLFNQPEILPIDDIDPAIGPLVPVARELNLTCPGSDGSTPSLLMASVIS